MPAFIKSHDNKNKPIIDAQTDGMSLIYFNLIKLKKGQRYKITIRDYETVWVVMQGNCNIKVDQREFKIWAKEKISGVERQNPYMLPSNQKLRY
jgi:5-deoxy-glucuronate isomerase